MSYPNSETHEHSPRIETLLILGASGDLTGRLLLPGLASLLAEGKGTDITLVGAGSDDWTAEQWRSRLKESFSAAHDTAQNAADDAGERALARIQTTSEYVRIDVTEPGALAKLLGSLQGPIAIYFALPPAISQKACSVLKASDLPAGTRLVLEKPFGSGQESAHALNETLASLVPEHQIHRVDHFLGKSTVLNILGLRFANRLLEPLWNNNHIEKVEIVFDEALTLEDRARYYDTAGALRDMIQSHLLEVMALIAIDPPTSISERDLRDQIGAVLRATAIDGAPAKSSRRARYTAGTIGACDVPNYVDEAGIDAARQTETLAEVQVAVSSWRWAGVPFILRSGKALGAARKEALITFKPVPHLPAGLTGVDTPTRLRIGFGPDTLQLEIDVNGPGDVFTLNRTTLSADLHASRLSPYGEVLDGVLSGDPLLSVRSDTAEECWRIVEPVLKAWKNNEVPLEEYPAGSDGPSGWPS
ncbi:glucose-6-phosphate dehydrogenase [Saxibacter everestensis]|uniref:Glucose-6-phosphate 1-dehydrogenase n=1 Tax=Saxibacter everestensis TaxID=2909229 RepID=A0ABY8QW18_9MICO|nr:glucose-6-phosphate dehydrogenase [Brevibacteriaceae bacterium ZFBP1038]